MCLWHHILYPKNCSSPKCTRTKWLDNTWQQNGNEQPTSNNSFRSDIDVRWQSYERPSLGSGNLLPTWLDCIVSWTSKNSWTISSASYLETPTTHGHTLPLWFETGAPYLEYLRALRSEKPGLILERFLNFDFWTSWIVSNTVQDYCSWNAAGYNPCSY